MTRAPMPPLQREGRTRLRELLGGALLVAAFALVFLWTPIAHTDEVLVPAQASQLSSLTRVAGVEVAAGTYTAESTSAGAWSRNVPWALFSRAAIRDRRLPLWNDLSGPGAPHLANLDAAVLSPFTLPWYVLDVRAAAIVAAFARLFALGLFTFLFLRELRVAFAAAVAGAVVFQFAGANVVDLFGPQSAAAVLAPAGLFVVERMARATERVLAEPTSGARARAGFGTAAMLALVTALGFLTGGFATFAFALLLVLAWAIARFTRIGVRESWASPARRELARVSLHVIGALLVATAIASIQLLPWIEGMRGSSPLVREAVAREPLTAGAWALQAFPLLLDTLSSASSPGTLRADRHAPWSEHVGSIALFLALLGLLVARRRRVAWFFAIAGVAWFVIAHGIAGQSVFELWPARELAPIQHGVIVLALSAAVLSALALDRVASGLRTGDARIALGVLMLGAAFLWMLRSKAGTVAGAVIAEMPGDRRGLAQLASHAYVDAISATFCAALLCVAVAIAIGPGRARSVLVLLVGVTVFAQTGWLLRDIHPLAPRSIVYPATEAVQQLVHMARGSQVVVLGADGIPPDTHLPFGLRQLTVSEPERTARCDRLVRAQFVCDGDTITAASERALRLFGAGIVLQKNRWNDAELQSGSAGSAEAPFASAEILPDAPFVQRFVDVRGQPGPLGFEWVTNGWRNECTFSVALDDALSGQRIVESFFGPGDLRPRGQTRMPCNIEIPAEERRPGRKLVLRIASDDAVAGRSWSVLCRTTSGATGDDWHAQQGAAAVAGRLALQPDEDSGGLRFEQQIGPFAARTCADAPRFRTVARAFAAGGSDEAFDTVSRAGFDPRVIVVLEGAEPGSANPRAEPESGRVDILEERDGRVRLHARRATPGWLVADIAWYPGWRARVNGVSATPRCANYAFTAVPLPAGEAEVDLEFAPASVRTGAVISGLGVLALACMMGAAFAAGRARD